MPTEMTPIPITPWPGEEGTIVRVPLEDVHKLQSELKITPAGLLPPYRYSDWHYTATNAAMIRGAFRAHRVIVPIPVYTLKDARKYMEVMRAGGFDAFAFPETPGGTGGSPVQYKAGFWNTSGALRAGDWYHLCGSDGTHPPPAELPGLWSWSEEGL